MHKGKRLDLALVEGGYVQNRSKAQSYIKEGFVFINGRIVQKANFRLKEDDKISLSEAILPYVSRGALKLRAAFAHFDISVSNKIALDVGASTGGFSQLLLEKGAQKVIAIDVGHNQMEVSLRRHPKISLYEGVNARFLTPEQIGCPKIEFIACDVSFISLRLALPNILNFVEPGTEAVLLVKPQFEVGYHHKIHKNLFNKMGVLKEKAFGYKLAEELYDWLDNFPSWSAKDLIASPIIGGDGNQEYLLFGRKEGQ